MSGSNRITFKSMWQFLAVAIVACATLHAQEQSRSSEGTGAVGELYTSSQPYAVSEDKIVPVRVLREFELGTELERFSSVTNRLVEKHETELPDAILKVDRGVFTPVAISVNDAFRRESRRLGARIEYQGTSRAGQERASNILDLDELKQLENALNVMLRAATQAPSKDDVLAYQYRTRSGFTVSLTIAQGRDGAAMNATVGKATADTREKSLAMLEQSIGMVHKLVYHLSSY